MSFELAPLPYSYDALSPTIDELTMRIHHLRHHGAYVAGLNAALDGTPWADRPIGDTLAHLDQVPADRRAAVRHYGGGHANHLLFWESMSPDGGGEPNGALAAAIRDSFGSVEEMKRRVNETAAALFGSGWAWLVYDGHGLAVCSTSNQDTPVMNGGGTPLLGIDMWEHAYYLKFQNRRADYLEAWWYIVAWDVVAARLAAVTR
jgi:superoxide dismutase, Fe-Mn family